MMKPFANCYEPFNNILQYLVDYGGTNFINLCLLIVDHN